MNTLRAGELRLEPQTAVHAAEMFEVLSDPAIYEHEGAPPASPAWLEERYRKLETRRSADGSQQWLNWIVRLPTGEAAGYVQATVMPGGWALVAYELASRFWRRGIGRAAVTAMLGELARGYGVHDAVAVLKRSNTRSHGLLLALGFEDAAPEWVERARPDDDERVMHRALSAPLA